MDNMPKYPPLPAPLGKRLLAFLADFLIGGLPFFILVGAFMTFIVAAMFYVEWPVMEYLLRDATETTVHIWALATFLSFIWLVYYNLLRDSFKDGQSWGKRLFGLGVIHPGEEKPCSKFGSLTRNFLGLALFLIAPLIPLIGFLLLLVEPLAVLLGEDRLRIGDRWAGTRVVFLPQGAGAREFQNFRSGE